MDYLFLNYLISRGLEPKGYALQVGNPQLSVPLVGLTFVGVLIVAIAAWSNMVGAMPVATARELALLENIRVLRAAALAIFFFSAFLYAPYVIGASAFWAQMAWLGRGIPLLAGSLQSLLNFAQPMVVLDGLTKLAISQNVAAAALVVVSGMIGYSQRRIKRAR